MNTTTAAHAKQITDDKLDTKNTDWSNKRRSIMYELLMAKCVLISFQLLYRMQMMNLLKIPVMSRTGQGQNMLGKLVMAIREGLAHQHSMKPGQEYYRPPANGTTTPCYKCGEGNHTQSTCRHQGFL